MRQFLILIALALFTCEDLLAQPESSTKYYDSLWRETTSEKGFYYTQYSTTDSIHKATAFWVRSGKLKYIIYYTDTTYNVQKGLSRKYYEDGQLEDSSLYNNQGEMIMSYYYYPNGELWVEYIYDTSTRKEITKAYDASKNLINDFIYLREADFRGGMNEWQYYLAKNIKTKVPIRNDAPNGQFQVIIRFIIDSNGKVSDVEPETNLGYGMEEEVMRIIKKSPKWIPAIRLNKEVNAYRRQPITFVVSED